MRRSQNRRVILFSVLIFLSIVFFCHAQKDYNWGEKELLQKYKVSNPDFLKGKKALSMGDLQKAEKELNKCLERMPQHAEAHFYLSQVFYKQGNLEKALEEMEKAKSNYGAIEKIIARQDQERILMLQERRDTLRESLPGLKEQLAKLPFGSDQRRELELRISNMEKELSDIDNRLSNPLPVIDKTPAEYFYFYGNILFKMKNLQEAESQYLKAILIDPKHANAYNNLATLYYMNHQYEKALKYLNQAEANGAQVNPELKGAVLKALGK
jgi:tetratricopeptide (TPR) repeat protein